MRVCAATFSDGGGLCFACCGSGAVSPSRTKGVWGRRGAGSWRCDKKDYVDDEMEMQTFGYSPDTS